LEKVAQTNNRLSQRALLSHYSLTEDLNIGIISSIFSS